jgi:sugar lactone lactonase YvrE
VAQGGTGIITTVAGGGNTNVEGIQATRSLLNEPYGVAVDDNGTVYIADRNNNQIRRVSPDGIITTFAGNGERGFSGDGGLATQARLSFPEDVAVDTGGNVYIADTLNHRIRRVSPDGIITTIQADLSAPRGLAVDNKGNIYFVDQGSERILRIGVDGITTVFAGRGKPPINSPFSVAADAKGNVYISDRADNQIRRIGPDGIVTTISGIRGYVAVDPNGTLYSVTSSTIYRTEIGGTTSTTKIEGLTPRDITVDNKGNVYIVESGKELIIRLGQDGAVTTVAGGGTSIPEGVQATKVRLYFPYGVAADAKGNLYIAEAIGNRIRRVNSNGIITTFAGTGEGGFSGDGGLATQARLKYPTGVAIDTKGIVYIVDHDNSRIRRVDTDGIITTFAGGEPPSPRGLIGDDGPATKANLAAPYGVAVDAKGVIYIADTYHERIRRVSTDGIITTFAGIGSPFFAGASAGDGGPAIQASFGRPQGVALDYDGVVYNSDTINHRVRRI